MRTATINDRTKRRIANLWLSARHRIANPFNRNAACLRCPTARPTSFIWVALLPFWVHGRPIKPATIPIAILFCIFLDLGQPRGGDHLACGGHTMYAICTGWWSPSPVGCVPPSDYIDMGNGRRCVNEHRALFEFRTIHQPCHSFWATEHGRKRRPVSTRSSYDNKWQPDERVYSRIVRFN